MAESPPSRSQIRLGCKAGNWEPELVLVTAQQHHPWEQEHLERCSQPSKCCLRPEWAGSIAARGRRDHEQPLVVRRNVECVPARGLRVCGGATESTPRGQRPEGSPCREVFLMCWACLVPLPGFWQPSPATAHCSCCLRCCTLLPSSRSCKSNFPK